MNDPVQALRKLLQPSSLQQTLFPTTSRYAGIETTTLVMPSGRTVAYLRRRFVPPAESLALLQVHTVTEGERVDQIAARYFGEGQQSWRLADGNGAMKPEELTEVIGRRLRITLPAGMPAGSGGDDLG